MDRKGSNWSGEWYSIVLSWVNSQVEGNKPSVKLSYVCNTDFLVTVIRSIYESENRQIPLFRDNEHLCDGFIKDYFPEFYKEQKFNIKEEEQVLILLSLVMYVSCVQCQIKDVHTKCCTFLDSNAQEKLTVFFQQMELIGKGKFTKSNVIKAIQTSLGIISSKKKKSISPGLPSNCLENFFNSPTLQMKKGETKEINRLKNLLKEQNNEYNDLAERNQVVEVQLKRSQTEVKTLQQKVKELITENTALKEELNEKDIESCEPVKKEYDDKLNKKLIEDLEIELEELKSENDQFITKLSKSESEVTQLKCDLKIMELKVNSVIEDCQHSQVQLNSLEAENSALKKEVEDLKNINEELQNQTERFDLQNLSCPRIEENLGEVLLADKQNELEALSKEMASLKQSFEIDLKEKTLEVEELKIKEKNYESVVKSKEETISNLKQEVGNLKNKLINIDKSMICLREELESLNEGLTKELELKCSEVKELSDKLHTLECRYNEIQSTLSETKTSLNETTSEVNKKNLVINELQSNLNISEQNNEENKKAYETIVEEHTTLKQDFSNLSLEIVEKNKHIASVEDILLSEREKTSNLNCELVEKDNDLKRAKHELESEKEQLMEKCNEVSKYTEEMNHLKEKVSSLKLQNSQFKEAHDKHIDDFNRLTDEHGALNSKYKYLEESYKKLKAEYDIKLKQIEDQMILDAEQLKIKEMENESIVKSKEETISSLQQEVGEVKSNLIIKDKAIICLREELESINEGLTKELELKCSEVKELSDKLHTLECRYNEIQSTLSETKTSLNETTSEVNKKNLVINELQSILNISEQSNEENKKVYEKIVEEHTTLKQDFSNLSLEIVEKNKHIASIEDILLSEREKTSNMNCELVEKDNDLKRAKHDLESEKEQLMEKCNEVSKCTEEINHLNGQVSSLELQNSQFKEAHDKHIDDFNRLTNEHGALRSTYVSLEESYKKLKADYKIKLKQIEDEMIHDAEKLKIKELENESIVKSKEERISSLEQEVGDVKSNLIIKDKAIICLREELESINEGWTKELELKCSEVKELSDKLHTLECRYNEIQSTLSETKTSLNETTSEVNKKNLVINELQSNLNISEQSNEENKKVYEKIVEEHTTLKQDFSNLSLEIVEKNKHIASIEDILLSEREKMSNLNCELVEKDNDLKRAKHELESEKEQLMEKCNEVSKCTEEINHLNGKVSSLELQNSQFKEAHDKHIDDFNRLTNEHGALRSTYVSLEESYKKLKADYEIKLKQIEDEMIHDAEKLKIKELENESIVKSKEERISSLEQEVGDVKSNLIIKDKAIICLREELESINEGLTKELELKCSEVKELSDKLHTLECRYNEIQSTLSETKTSLNETTSEVNKKNLVINELHSNLNISEQSNEENKKVYEKIVEEHTTLKQDFSNLSLEIVEKNKHIASIEDILLSEREKMSNLNCELVEKDNDLKRAKHELESEKEQLMEKCNEVSKCTEEINHLNGKVSSLELQNSQFKEAHDKHIDDFNRLTNEHGALRSTYVSLEESYKKLKADYEIKLKQIEDEMIHDAEKLKIKELENESIVKSKEERISSLEQEVGDVKSNLIIKDKAIICLREELESINEGLTKELELKCSEVKELSDKLHTLECRYNEIQSTLSETKTSLNETTSEVNKKNLVINELQSNLNISEQSNEENKKVYEKIVEEHTTLKQDFSNLSLEIVEKNKHIASIEDILLSEREKMSNLNCELVEKDNDLKRAKHELESEKEQLMEKCNEVSKCTEEINHLNGKVSSLELQNSQFKEAHDKHIDDFNRLTNEHGALRSTYVSLEESYKKLKADYEIKLKQIEDEMIHDAEKLKIKELENESIVKSKEERISSLEQEVGDVKSNLIIKDKAIICLREELESINEGLTKELELKCSEVKELSDKLHTLECRYNEIQSTLSETKTSLNETTSEVNKKNLVINELQSNLNISEQSNEENKKVYEKIVEEHTTLKQDFSNLSLEIVEKNKHIASIEDILLSEREKMSNLNCELVEKDNDLKRAKHELESEKEQLMEKCNEVSKCTEGINHLNGKVSSLELQNSQFKEAHDKHIDDFNRLTNEHGALRSTYVSLEESYKKLKADYEIKLKQIEDEMIHDAEELKIKEMNYESIVKSKEETISSLQQEVGDVKSDLIIKNKAIICIREELESINEGLTKELELKCSEVKELQSNLNISEQSNEENKKVYEKIVEEHTTLKQDFSNLSLEIVEKNKHIASIEDILMSEREKMSKLNVELLEKCTDLKRAEYELQSKKDQLMEKCNEVSKCTEEINRLNENVNLLEQQIIQQDPQLKEAHDKLFDDFNRLSDEHDALNSKCNSLDESNKNIRAEYDLKLKKIKDQMKVTCTKAMQQTEENCKQRTKKLEEVIKSSQDHNTQLSSQLWDTSDKLIITKKENENLKRTVMELEKAVSHQNMISTFRTRTRSYEHLGCSVAGGMRQEADDTSLLLRRQTMRTVPTGMGIKLLPSGKVFPSEDEAEEMFSNECLADLKAGHCNVQTDPDRVSTLRYRNSLCPPHLKSSYPAETQFFPIDSIQEDDIKGRDGISEDTKGLPDKQRRKERSQTSYKRPGPPTPSKHGGRLSQSQELKPVVATPRNVLRELNEEHKKPGTPSRLFSQLFPGKQRGENTPTTPNQRRLSFFNKHFGKREGFHKNPE